MPKVSVIVPNYNHASFLPQRIDSILNQTYQDFELILLDDASSDNSTAILNNYSHIDKVSEIVLNRVNSGSPFKQWIKGIKLAKGDFIWIAESDDFAEPNFLETTVSLMNHSTDITLVYTDSQTVDDQNNNLNLWSVEKNKYFKTDRWSRDYVNDGKKEILNYLLYRTTINNASAVLFRKENLDQEFLEKLNRYKSVGDLSLYLNTCYQGAIAYSSLPLNNYRAHHYNVTAMNKKSGTLYLERLDCFVSFLPIFNEELKNKEEKIKVIKAYNFILRKNITKLLENNELNAITDFIKKMRNFEIFSAKKTTFILILVALYNFKNKFTRRLILKQIKYQLA